MSGILKYFRPVEKPPREQLPDPHGPLNTDGKVPSSAIASANIAVRAVQAEASDKSSAGTNSRGHYLYLTPVQKFNIGKRASEHGVTSTLCYYKKTFPDLPLKETSV